MTEFGQGRILGGRFEILGILGKGGTAVVHLAYDRLREGRVALKVVHPHLAHDPAVRTRLRREVHAASVLRHEAALTALDLHEFDGILALTLPFHPGRTLAEQVASSGPLDSHALRDLAVRLAGALAEAHRSGLLHRDVTPNNVMVGGPGAALTDFGLAAAAEPGSSRSTVMLGTTGYAAPEVHAGVRRDPRSDLYGLGAVLYLAATGRDPFAGPTPMAVLQRQLDEDHLPLSEVRPDLPPVLSGLIDRLLRADPDRRPQGAQEVLDVLELGSLPPEERVVRELPAPPERHLPPGPYTVVVKERREDAPRRHRRRHHGFRRAGPERQLQRMAQPLIEGIQQFLGLPNQPHPEEQLVAEVAKAARLPSEALAMAPEVLDKHFRLVDGVDRATAQRLHRKARELGFKATIERIQKTSPWARHLNTFLETLYLGLLVLWIVGLPVQAAIFIGVVATLLIKPFAGSSRVSELERLPVAYDSDLGGHLAEGYEHLALAPRTEAKTRAPSESKGRRLAARALERLEALERAIGESSLPAPAVRDLRATVSALRRSAEGLAVEIDRLELAVAEKVVQDEGWIHVRLARLETLQRAGEPVEEEELDSLRGALEAMRADQAAAAALESRLTATQAQLLEIASAASRVRRELLTDDSTSSADRLLARLQQQTRAADAARREAGMQQAARAAARQTS